MIFTSINSFNVINLFAIGSIIATKFGYFLYISSSSAPVRLVERDEVETGGATVGLTALAANNDVGFSSTGTSGLRAGKKTAILSY